MGQAIKSIIIAIVIIIMSAFTGIGMGVTVGKFACEHQNPEARKCYISYVVAKK